MSSFDHVEHSVEFLGKRAIFDGLAMIELEAYDVRFKDCKIAMDYVVRVLSDVDRSVGELVDYALKHVMENPAKYRIAFNSYTQTVEWLKDEDGYLRGEGMFALELRRMTRRLNELESMFKSYVKFVESKLLYDEGRIDELENELRVRTGRELDEL